jgi:hypothetical protein
MAARPANPPIYKQKTLIPLQPPLSSLPPSHSFTSSDTPLPSSLSQLLPHTNPPSTSSLVVIVIGGARRSYASHSLSLSLPPSERRLGVAPPVGAATSRKATAALEHLDGCAATLDQLDELHSRFVRISLLLSRPPPRWDLDQLNELHSRSVGISLLLSRPPPRWDLHAGRLRRDLPNPSRHPRGSVCADRNPSRRHLTTWQGRGRADRT